MEEITADGYQDLRDYIQSTWKYVEIRDQNKVPIFRIPTTDQRVSWTHQPGDSIMELRVSLTGTDADIHLPQTIGGSAIYKTATGGIPMAEREFTSFTFESPEDQLVIIHRIHVPYIEP